jgi:hypothetical protein
MRRFLPLAAVTLFLAGPAMGLCNVPNPRLVCAEYFASKLVVEATLVKVRSIHAREDPQGVAAHFYTLQANRLIRGHVTEVFRVYEGNDSGRASFDWTAGQKYLLFLFYSTADKSWELDGCGNSGPLNLATSALQEIAAIRTHNDDGVIHGVVSDQSLAPVSDMRVEARGAKGIYRATTNSKGEFEIKVPAGRYRVRGSRGGHPFYAADFSYENPDNLQIEPGGCAQIQLVAP